MRICLYGAGAIGGHLAARLAAIGEDVSAIARGPQLAAIREKGITLRSGDKVITGPVHATDRPADLGPQDIVVVTVKATGLPIVADALAPLIGPETGVVFLQNGITWWYPVGLGASARKPPELPVFKVGQSFLSLLRPEQVWGASIYSGNSVPEPGVIHNSSAAANSLAVGRADDQPSALLDRFRDLLTRSGISVPETPDVRASLWAKVIRVSPVAALCVLVEQSVGGVYNDPALKELHGQIIEEFFTLTEAYGYPLRQHFDKPILAASPHKPSMLQDYEAGRPMEIEEMILAPLAFGRAAGVAMPVFSTIAALCARKSAEKGLFQKIAA